MANSNNAGNFSQRRTEALKFLSCISLDGTYCRPDRNFPCKNVAPIRKFNNLIMEEDTAIEGIDSVAYVLKEFHGIQIVKNSKCDADRHSLSSGSEINVANKQIVEEPILTKTILPQSTKSKKRLRSNSELGTRNITSSTKKKLQYSLAGSDSEYHYESSCESIGPVTSHVKPKSLTSKVISELNGDVSIKYVKSVKDHKFNGERIFMMTKKRFPFLVCSFIPYGRSEKHRSDMQKEVFKKRHASRSRPLSISSDTYNRFELFGILRSEDGQEVSYGKLLLPTHSFKEYLDKKYSSNDAADDHNYNFLKNQHRSARTKILTRKRGYKWCYSYDQGPQMGIVHVSTSPPVCSTKENTFLSSMILYNPSLLDDPELMAGKHRTLLTFSSYTTSIIDYVRPSDLKKNMNDKFREKFPYIKLTLSKLRSIKREMCKAAKTESGTELLTVAQAYVYFEKLILRGLINKQNRKLCAAASLLLSAKLNDFKGDALKLLIERIESVFRLNRRELFESEFAVLVALEFGLHIPTLEVFPHYQRLLYGS